MKKRPAFANVVILCAFMVIFSQLLFAQGENVKFGKIDIKDLQSTRYEKDTSAEALVLFDKGTSYYDYVEGKGFYIVYERHLRIKIYKKSGYSHADHEFSFYHTDNLKEEITSLKGRTYNLENGKITETKLEDKSVFEEAVTKNWSRKKFAMPAIREGSVFEIKYVIRSPFITDIRDWMFQGSIPVVYSEYEVRIPEYFHYNMQTSGFLSFSANEHTSENASVAFLNASREQVNQYVVGTQKYSYETVTYVVNDTKLAVKDVPAMKPESWVTTVDNYRQKVEYEFQSYQLPQDVVHTFTTTWTDVAETLLKDDDFGGQLKKSGIVRDMVKEISAKATSPFEKMVLAFDKIKTMMAWNGRYSKYPVTSLRDAYNQKSGNSADINLLLILLLKELGLEVDPVVLSTRENGIVKLYPPVLTKFNAVIARVKADDKIYMLDATQKFRSYDQLPFEYLNGSGLLVAEGRLEWVKLLRDERSGNFCDAKMVIGKDGTIAGTMSFSSSGYPGMSVRKEFADAGDEKFKHDLKAKQKNWDVEKIEVENMVNPAQPVKTTYTMSTREETQPGDIMYLNVLLNKGQANNPFNNPERKYPVDFGCPVKDNYLFVMEIPEGYKVESLPAPYVLSLEKQGGMFKFMTAVDGNKITVSSSLSVNQVFFGSDEYKGLREFFARIVAKHAEQIILKKI